MEDLVNETMEKVEITAPASGMRVAHRQDPAYGRPPPFVALCGAEVIGIVADVPLSCPDCIELVVREKARRREWMKRHPPKPGRPDPDGGPGPSRDWFA